MLVNRRTALLLPTILLARTATAQTMPPFLQDYERQTRGRVGLHAENIATGAKITWRNAERFVMCSTFKASLAACVLVRVDRGEDNLNAMVPFGQSDLGDFYAPVARENLTKGALSVEEMCKAAMERSDNVCANLLLARIGGPPAMTAFWRATGDSVTRLDHNEPMLNRSPLGDPHDTTTPAAMAGTLRRLVLGNVLSASSRMRFTNWLLGCQTGGNRLRAGRPATWVIGDKTGNNGSDAAGDIAVAWPTHDAPILIAAYTQGGSPTQAQLETVFIEIGRAVSLHLQRSP